ncbi:MAG TPA: carboxypeptidase regulatory-like domain-containing protein [Gammaproteobacteria bacterium]|nr:carboxypeptidase regulatory-like domain-containing protein [Gammaproteobacteria bacterium]
MPVTRLGWVAALCATVLALAACAQLPPEFTTATTPAASAAIAVYATGADDAPLRDALVYLRPVDAQASDPPATATLDLMHRQFEPRVLAVSAGTEVTIHNLDEVDHDLYSFSPAMPFSLRLAAKGGSAPLKFAHPGVVVLGCKVHDEMVGYVYVTDTPYYGKTDGNGYLRLAGLPPGRYTLGLWQAGVAGKDDAQPRPLTLTAGVEQAVRIRL